MAKIYVRWIQAGKMSLEDVPSRWQSEVSELLTSLRNAGILAT